LSLASGEVIFLAVAVRHKAASRCHLCSIRQVRRLEHFS
jgi:hypothetical protein